MTFEEALKRLAEKEPEKFQINGAENPHEDDWTQDDIDEILALIGWEYCVDRYSNLPLENPWFYEFWRKRKQGDTMFGSGNDGVFPDKLSAAKDALIAVVEREFGQG